jgi:hypothetical protein
MDDREPARPAEMPPGPPTPCERKLEEKNAENAQLREELAAKNAENAQLKEQVAELKAKLGPYLGPPAGPLRPYPPEGPWVRDPEDRGPV